MDIVEQSLLECYLAYLENSREFGFVPVSLEEYEKSIREMEL